MTFKILITDDLSPQGLVQLEEADDVTFDIIKGLSTEELAERIRGYDGLIVRSSVNVTKDVLAAADRLKVIGRAGVGLDNIDINAASLKGIIVMNTPGANTMATAEHTMAMLLAVCRHVPQADASIRAKQWARKQFLGVQLYHKTLGIIGLGRIGSKVAQRAQAFGMAVIAYDPYISDEIARELKVSLVDLNELLARSDFITLNVALTPETQGIINAQTIAQMKPGVRLINCARGKLIDEPALVEALQAGRIAGAALDVFANEPLPPDSKLHQLPNVVFTPHIAASTLEAQRDVGTQIVKRVLAALRGEDYRNAVNMPVANVNVFKELNPYLRLAEKLGSLQMQLAGGRVKRVEIEVHGQDVTDHIKPLVVALLKGLLDPVLDTPANYISAPHLALQRGISVTETKGMPKLNYANLLSCRVKWDDSERLVSGSLLGRESPRVVQIDDFELDAQLEGIILVLESLNVPGVVGQVATLLGKHDINISEWRMGTTTPTNPNSLSTNLSFINLDSPALPEVLVKLTQLEKVFSVSQVSL